MCGSVRDTNADLILHAILEDGNYRDLHVFDMLGKQYGILVVTGNGTSWYPDERWRRNLSTCYQRARNICFKIPPECSSRIYTPSKSTTS
jgi:hypothetical protein